MSWLTAPLRKVAPAITAQIAFAPDDHVWQLSLDQIESETGEIVGKRYAVASDAGTSTFNFDSGNVLYSKLRPYLNKVAIPDESGIATTELIPLRPDPKTLNPRFLAYYLRSPGFVNQASHHIAGAKMPRVVMDWFWEHEAPIPSPKEQFRIVELLDEAARLRRLRREADAKAARILPALFLKMFGDPATNPMGWPTDRLDSWFDVFGGGTPSKANIEYWKGDIPWASPKDMKVDVIQDTEDHITQDAVVNSATKLVAPGSILIVYRSGILAHTFPVAIAGRTLTLNQDLKALTSRGEVLNEFIYGWLVSGQKLALSCVKKGATVHNIDGPRFLSLEVPKPPRQLQEDFARCLQALLHQKNEREKAAEEVETLFDLLLQKAFSGGLTAKWREAHIQELLAEMAQQARALNLPLPKELVALS